MKYSVKDQRETLGSQDERPEPLHSKITRARSQGQTCIEHDVPESMRPKTARAPWAEGCIMGEQSRAWGDWSEGLRAGCGVRARRPVRGTVQ
jgi:hypothetical protein